MTDFGASGSLPTLLQNTLRLRGTALSAVGRPGMENLDATRKKERKKEAGKIYVLIHICGHGHFLNAFNTLTVKRKAHRGNFKSESERIKVHCNNRLVCDFIQTIKRLCICCNVMTGFITRHFKMSFCMNFDLSLNVLFQNQPYFLQKISTNQAMKTKHYFSFRKDLYICLFVNVFQRAG